jgi:hypothetical protein
MRLYPTVKYVGIVVTLALLVTTLFTMSASAQIQMNLSGTQQGLSLQEELDRAEAAPAPPTSRSSTQR